MDTLFAALERRAARIALTLLGSVVLFTLLDIRESVIGELLRPAIGEPKDSGLWGRVSTAIVLTIVLWGNIRLINLLPRALRLPIVWLELLALFLAFFYSFDLSYDFIGRKIGFLVAQGAFTTVYISLVSISIACVIALIGALARMSSNPIAFGIATF